MGRISGAHNVGCLRVAMIRALGLLVSVLRSASCCSPRLLSHCSECLRWVLKFAVGCRLYCNDPSETSWAVSFIMKSFLSTPRAFQLAASVVTEAAKMQAIQG